jgi:hypothetical protein
MEETIINEPSLLEVLVSSPTTYVVLVVIALTIFQLKRKKSSPKPTRANKTSRPAKKKTAKKRTPSEKTAKKKAVRKRTPKKSGTRN